MQLSKFPILALAATLCSCDVALVPVPVAVTGVFRGTTTDGQVMEITAKDTPLGFTGHGQMHGAAVSLSFLLNPQPVGLVNANGSTSPSRAELSPDRDALTLKLAEGSAQLLKVPSVTPIPVSFSGRFISGGASDFAGQIDWVQSGNFTSGTGQIFGQTFALSGIVEPSGRFTGRAIFPDESEATIGGQLSDQNRSLSLLGFGSPLQFTR